MQIIRGMNLQLALPKQSACRALLPSLVTASSVIIPRKATTSTLGNININPCNADLEGEDLDVPVNICIPKSVSLSALRREQNRPHERVLGGDHGIVVVRGITILKTAVCPPATGRRESLGLSLSLSLSFWLSSNLGLSRGDNLIIVTEGAILTLAFLAVR